MGIKFDRGSYGQSMDAGTEEELQVKQKIVIIMLLSIHKNKPILFNNKKSKYKNYKTKFKVYKRNLENSKHRLNYTKLCLRLETLWKTI